jgi:hypothetical protein
LCGLTWAAASPASGSPCGALACVADVVDVEVEVDVELAWLGFEPPQPARMLAPQQRAAIAAIDRRLRDLNVIDMT